MVWGRRPPGDGGRLEEKAAFSQVGATDMTQLLVFDATMPPLGCALDKTHG